MRGEASLVEQLKVSRFESATATCAVKRGLEELSTTLQLRTSAIANEVAHHAARTESELGMAVEQQKAVAKRQELSHKALHLDLQNHAKATRSALAALEEKAARDVAELEARRVVEVNAPPLRSAVHRCAFV